MMPTKRTSLGSISGVPERSTTAWCQPLSPPGWLPARCHCFVKAAWSRPLVHSSSAPIVTPVMWYQNEMPRTHSLCVGPPSHASSPGLRGGELSTK